MTTVVTAFYPIQSKFLPTQYLEWAQRFLQLNAPIILFTEPALVPTFRAMRPFLPLHVIPLQFKDLDMWVLYESQWRKEHARDPEAAYHTPELYAIWAQKSLFVEKAIHENPFSTNNFYWCDIGAFRNPNITPDILANFPQTKILEDILKTSSGILLNSVAPLNPTEGPESDFSQCNRIVGGLWGGSAAACKRWRAAYEVQLIRYFAQNRFAGKDQSVMLSAYLEDPSLATVARPTTRDGDHWFFQQYLLTGKAHFEPDASYSRVGPPPLPPVTVRLMGGLGNQFFQIATAYAYTKQYHTRLLLPAEKEAEDGRPLYWSSALHRFQHFLQSPSSPLPTIKPTHWELAATQYTPIPPPTSLGYRLQGYFQSPKYFMSTAKEIRNLFSPSAEVLTKIKTNYANLLEMRDRIVVVHARRGDYLKAVEYHGVLGVDYYCKAMNRMLDLYAKERKGIPYFLLVMDEPLWWIEVLPQIPTLLTHPFQILMESDEVMTIGLLQQFQHFIIANSSFSWWAAYLADAPHVIAPKHWFGPTGPKQWTDMYMPHWETI